VGKGALGGCAYICVMLTVFIYPYLVIFASTIYLKNHGFGYVYSITDFNTVPLGMSFQLYTSKLGLPKM
jgi:hypothetical protein